MPIEAVLQCLTWLPGAHSHFVISTSCRTLREPAKQDDLWLLRLARDFPRVSVQGKEQVSLHITYRILTKAHRRHFHAKCERPTEGVCTDFWWQLMASRPPPAAVPDGGQRVAHRTPQSCQVAVLADSQRGANLQPDRSATESSQQEPSGAGRVDASVI